MWSTFVLVRNKPLMGYYYCFPRWTFDPSKFWGLNILRKLLRQPWHWLWKINISLNLTRKIIPTVCTISVSRKDWKWKYIFVIPHKYLGHKGLNCSKCWSLPPCIVCALWQTPTVNTINCGEGGCWISFYGHSCHSSVDLTSLCNLSDNIKQVYHYVDLFNGDTHTFVM